MTTKKRRDDPMLRALAAAPLDDEPTDLDQDASAEEALEAYRQGDGVSRPTCAPNSVSSADDLTLALGAV